MVLAVRTYDNKEYTNLLNTLKIYGFRFVGEIDKWDIYGDETCFVIKITDEKKKLAVVKPLRTVKLFDCYLTDFKLNTVIKFIQNGTLPELDLIKQKELEKVREEEKLIL
jgi:hypothetical protein